MKGAYLGSREINSSLITKNKKNKKRLAQDLAQDPTLHAELLAVDGHWGRDSHAPLGTRLSAVVP